jgi:putative tryptophan/tyrosine transport system substrate-binding protein
MRRREFVGGLTGTVLAWPFPTNAAPDDSLPRIGMLMTTAEADPEGQARARAFINGLEKLGWRESNNLRVDYRWYAGSSPRAKLDAAALMQQSPDLLLANGTPALGALKSITSTVPIVFVMVPDPLGQGFVPSLAHPGGNITGFTQFEYPIGRRWLQLLKEIAPNTARVAVLHNPDEFQSSGFLREIAAAAALLMVELVPIPAHDAVEIERAIEAFGPEPRSGLVVITSPMTTVHRELIVRLAQRLRLPAVYPYRFFAEIGGLLSYGVNEIRLFREAASYVDRILRRVDSVGDLPVQAPTKYDLVVNSRTARALGLEISPSLLSTADEVIE